MIEQRLRIESITFREVGRRKRLGPALLAAGIVCLHVLLAHRVAAAETPAVAEPQLVHLNGNAGGKRFDGIGIVNGGGATAVLLKDYPEPQRSQILDLVFRPKFGASVSALLVEIPGDGNSTQGSMPSHMHTRDDLDYWRGYMWWILREAKSRNPDLTLDGTAWSGPGWLGNGKFWSQDTADYYVKWLQGLRDAHGLEFDAIGCRNEKGVSIDFAKLFRATLNANGFAKVKLHAFDLWPKDKFDFVPEMMKDQSIRDSIDIIGAHILSSRDPASAEVQAMAAQMNKPIWNTEEHVYLKGFACAIGIVHAFNDNFIRSGATKTVNWYDIAALYPTEPYAEDPAMLLAHWPWSGHYRVREALWGYAHYGQFTQVGWQYLDAGCGKLTGGGTFVTLKSPRDDYSLIVETEGAKTPQPLRIQLEGGLSAKPLCVWRSNAQEQFIRQPDVTPVDGAFTITLDPDSIYSLSTTTGQRKGSFPDIPPPSAFPFPYRETFEGYGSRKEYGYLPRYTADIADAFELVERPDQKGKCLRQVVPIPTISWAPDWKPYTILGDEQWQDYEVNADICLNAGDTAGVMGRINHVGTGYGFIPKGYFLQLSDTGECQLIVVRGKPDKKKLVGDAEQQALIKAQRHDSEGGEKVLATASVPNLHAGEWHTLTLRLEGAALTGLVDGKAVVTATDSLYARGMAGLIAGAGKKLSTPYYDNLVIKPANAPLPAPSEPTARALPIYAEPPQPILEGFTADPAIRVFGDTYYIYPTSDKPEWRTTDFSVWSSKNLVEWKKERMVLDVAHDLKWANLRAWAPDCIERNGTYYFYFCGEGKIGVGTATSPAGPFVDALGKPLLDRKADPRITSNTIDPYPFIDDDGQAYLYWGNSSGKVNVVKLKPDMITVEGAPIEFSIKGRSSGQVIDFREGVVVFKRSGKYYFMWSVDDARSDNYRIAYGTATGPFGPITVPDNATVLAKNGSAKGTGHHSVVNVPGTDRWYVAYHRHAIPGGGGYKREVCLARMEFNPDGTIKPMDPMVTPFHPGDVGEPIVNGQGAQSARN